MKAEVKITGLPPGILFHNPASMVKSQKTARKIVPDPKVEAESYTYRNEHGILCIPSYALHRALIQAATGLKSPQNRKLTLAPFIAGDLMFEDQLISFGQKRFEIDARPVVIQRNRIVRYRPMLREWSAKFVLEWEPSTLGNDFHDVILPDLLSAAGHRIGIGDFRPAKGGPFGRFKVDYIKALR